MVQWINNFYTVVAWSRLQSGSHLASAPNFSRLRMFERVAREDFISRSNAVDFDNTSLDNRKCYIFTLNKIFSVTQKISFRLLEFV